MINNCIFGYAHKKIEKLAENAKQQNYPDLITQLSRCVHIHLEKLHLESKHNIAKGYFHCRSIHSNDYPVMTNKYIGFNNKKDAIIFIISEVSQIDPKNISLSYQATTQNVNNEKSLAICSNACDKCIESIAKIYGEDATAPNFRFCFEITMLFIILTLILCALITFIYFIWQI